MVDRLIFGLSRRSISMWIIDCHTNSITWLRSRSCKFSWAGSRTGYANSSGKKELRAIARLDSKLATIYELWSLWAHSLLLFRSTNFPCACFAILILFDEITHCDLQIRVHVCKIIFLFVIIFLWIYIFKTVLFFVICILSFTIKLNNNS